MGKSQEGNEPQEQLEKEFSRISQESILRAWEEKNRERISEAPFSTKDSFDKLWKKVIGRSYYQPVTEQPAMPSMNGQNNTQRSDPRGCKYRENITFSTILWQKLPRRKIGKRYRDLFTIKGIVQDNGSERPVYQNLTTERISELLSVEVKDKLMKASKTIDHGEVKGPFSIDVEGYWEVIFSPQSGPNDPKDVRLHWEGQCLVIQRMKNVVLPGFYIEVADNALRDHYTQTPEDGRKKVGTIQEYPYTTLRRATREEYLIQKEAGNKIQRAALRREENA